MKAHFLSGPGARPQRVQRFSSHARGTAHHCCHRAGGAQRPRPRACQLLASYDVAFHRSDLPVQRLLSNRTATAQRVTHPFRLNPTFIGVFGHSFPVHSILGTSCVSKLTSRERREDRRVARRKRRRNERLEIWIRRLLRRAGRPGCDRVFYDKTAITYGPKVIPCVPIVYRLKALGLVE